MEFEEMKKVWSVQNNEPLYVINEAAMRKSIVSKKDKALMRANISELISIITNIAVGIFLLTTGLFLLATWMIVVGLLCVIGRVRRLKGDKLYDRSMLGDLDYAISVATYQVRFSGLMRWNVIPLGLLMLWEMNGKENIIIMSVLLCLFFALAFFGSGLEHNYYKARRNEVVKLREMLLKASS